MTTPPTAGLGTDLSTLRKLCSGDRKALDAIDRATTSRQGARSDLVHNVNEVRPTGNSAPAALRRLRKDKPDLHAQVLAGNHVEGRAAVLSPNEFTQAGRELYGSDADRPGILSVSPYARRRTDLRPCASTAPTSPPTSAALEASRTRADSDRPPPPAACCGRGRCCQV